MISMRTAALAAIIAIGAGALAIAQPFGGGMGLGMMGGGYGYGPGNMMGYPGYGMAPGMMWGGGYGYGTGSMMGPGMMGYPGYGMGPGMMGGGYGYGPGNMMGNPGYGMGPSMMWGGGRYQRWADSNQALTVDQVKSNLERWLAFQGNDRLKVGEVVQKDDNTIEASIVTKKENAVVQSFSIDRKTGAFRPTGG